MINRFLFFVASGRVLTLVILLMFLPLMMNTFLVAGTQDGMYENKSEESNSAPVTKEDQEVESNDKENSTTGSALVLNGKTFREVVLQEPPKNGMVMFYQDWCTHSKRLLPHWERLAEEAPPSVYIGKVNCGSKDDGSSTLCHGKEIRQYPQLKYYYSGDEHAYNGARSFDALLTFVEDNMALPCKVQERQTTCSTKAQSYIEKWLERDASDVKKEILRLKKISKKNKTSNDDSSIKPETQRWIKQRHRILKQIWEEKSQNQDDKKNDEL